MELKEFLVRAKRATYANENAREKKIKGKGKLLMYSNRGLFYQDKYFGTNPFSGEEIIIKEGKVVWIMNYYGKTISKNSSKVYKFLRKALRKVDEDKPFRGPANFKEDDFRYINRFEGKIDSFCGVEKISYKNRAVYFCYYHGGFVK
jgi:hypothetical protein